MTPEEAMYLAADPTTSPDVLTRLAVCEFLDEPWLPILAANPALPFSAVHSLFDMHTHLFDVRVMDTIEPLAIGLARNPSLPLWLMAEPDALRWKNVVDAIDGRVWYGIVHTAQPHLVGHHEAGLFDEAAGRLFVDRIEERWPGWRTDLRAAVGNADDQWAFCTVDQGRAVKPKAASWRHMKDLLLQALRPRIALGRKSASHDDVRETIRRNVGLNAALVGFFNDLSRELQQQGYDTKPVVSEEAMSLARRWATL